METSTWYVINGRLAWIRMHQGGVPVTGVCQHYGISRKTFYKWLRRYRKGGRDFHVLRNRSRQTPQPSHSYSPGHGGTAPGPQIPHRLRPPPPLTYYLVQDGYRLSVFGAYRVLQRADLVKKPRSRPRKKLQSYAMLAPGQRVQVDVKYLPPLCLRKRPEPLQ